MGKYSSLIASIVNNIGKHQVNREEKMSRTIDKMVSNTEIKAEKLKWSINFK